MSNDRTLTSNERLIQSLYDDALALRRSAEWIEEYRIPFSASRLRAAADNCERAAGALAVTADETDERLRTALTAALAHLRANNLLGCADNVLSFLGAEDRVAVNGGLAHE